MPKTLTPIGEIIEAWRRENPCSLDDLAKEAGLSKGTIFNLLYSSRSPRRDTLELLGEVVGRSPDDLLRAHQSPRKPEGFVSFSEWLRERKSPGLWISLIGIVVAAAFLWNLRALHLVQAMVIFALYPLLPRHRLNDAVATDYRMRIASAAANDFRRFWGRAWLCWGLLYVLLAAMPLPYTGRAELLVVLNAVQNVGTVFLFCCWEVLARRTIRESLTRKPLLSTRVWIAVIATLAVVEYGTVTVDRFLAEGNVTLDTLHTQRFLGWISGFAQGTALVLLVSRFGSQYIGKPSLAIGLLLFYAVIQGAWPAFAGDPALTVSLTLTALVLKCLLFLFVAWFLESDVILYYFVRSRELDETLEKGDRWKFLQAYKQGDLKAVTGMLPAADEAADGKSV